MSRVYHDKETDAIRIENFSYQMPLSKRDAESVRDQLNKLHEAGMIP